MSQLTKAAKAQNKNFSLEYRSFNAASIACLSAAREEYLQPYFERAGVPSRDASNTEKVDFMRANVLPSFAQTLLIPTKGITFKPSKNAAYRFLEGVSVDSFQNCDGLQIELGTATGENGALRTAYVYREKTVLQDVVLKDNGAAGKVYKIDETTGKRAKVQKVVREYVCERGGVYNFAEVCSAFMAFLGIPEAIAQEALEAAQLKAAKAVQAADVAAANAKAAAEKAKENAQKAKKRASEKEQAAKKEQALQGMGLEQAAEIIGKAESRKAAEQGEKAETASRANGELSKKPCKNTMKQAANELHNYERVQK